MTHTTLFLLACVCIIYVTEGRSLDQSERRLETRGIRKPRAHYGIGGYLYGKRSQVTEDDLMRTVSRQYMALQEAADIMQKDHAFAMLVAKKLDTDGDGYVQVTDLL
ncbi:sensorin-A-like [Haliotis asinina]|uniref:sensorin-A-like n=1 Tax=Haliotis asinina TaxID=109174 RepID=UPI0035322808